MKDKVDKIQQLSFEKAENLIYQWVKTGHITLKEFKQLCSANRDSIY